MPIKNLITSTLLFLLIIFCQFANAETTVSTHSANNQTIRSGWYHWAPFQFEKEDHKTNSSYLTGLDVEFTKALFGRLNYKVDFADLQWKAHHDALKAGTRDIAAGAFITPDRQKYAYYSAPYRNEVNVLYVRKADAGKYRFNGAKQMLAMFKEKHFILGIVKGYAYGGAGVMDYIKKYSGTKYIVPARNEVQNFKNLIDGRIDGFIADRLVAATIAWQNDLQKHVTEHSGFFAEEPVHFMFSKKTTNPELIQRVNKAIKEMKQEGLYQQIVGSYMFPILLGITISQPWFFFIEILGIIAFAAAGFITAKKEGYSLIGTFFIAGLPAIGGGVMRDLLISRDHIFIISTPEYIYTIVWVVACGYFLLRLYDLLHWLLRDKLHLATSALQKSIAYKVIQFPWVQVLDALGLSCFTIVGVVVAVEARLTPLLFWGPLLGMFTCILGGIVQNMVRGNTNIAVLRGLLYPEISLLWGFILCLFIRWEATRLYINEVYLAVILCLIGGFLTRLIMMKFKIKGPML